jgi:hypothetical protein
MQRDRYSNLSSSFERSRNSVSGIVAVAVCGSASAGIVSLYADAYVVNVGGQLFSVIDLYADLPGTGWQVGNAWGDVSLLGGSTWFHDDATGLCPSGGTWLPVPSAAHPLADSFVTIGLPAQGAPNITLLAPTFISDPACSSFLGPGAGWLNPTAQTGQGKATDIALHDGSLLLSATMLGRFSVAGLPVGGSALNLRGFTIGAFFASAPPEYSEFNETFTYVPAPATVCFLAGLAFSSGRRRRQRLNA